MQLNRLRNFGWLSTLTRERQDAVLDAGRIQSYRRGTEIIRVGDPPGGPYAVLDGEIAVSIAPHLSGPVIVHLATPGWWIAEGAFLTRNERQLGLTAKQDSTLFYLPLDALERLAADDPEWIRLVGQMLMLNVGVTFRTIGDLLIPEPKRRVASTLLRCIGQESSGTVTVSQLELGHMTNTSRKVVNRVLADLAERGLVSQSYGRIEVISAAGLRAYADGE